MNLPNLLTISRLVLSIIFVGVCSLWWNSLAGRIVALVIALFAEATDIAVGYFARKHNLVSDTGKLLDPYADKIWRFSAFLCIGMRGYADLWMVAVIFWRMLTVSHIRTIAVMKGKIIAARLSGKIKAVVQGCGILVVLACAITQRILDTHSVDISFSFQYISWWIMAVVTVVTFLSAIDYVYSAKRE